jgi:hypothetical protein
MKNPTLNLEDRPEALYTNTTGNPMTVISLHRVSNARHRLLTREGPGG